MTLICFVRHGETSWNVLKKIQGRTDIPLNEVGIKQAIDCKEYLSKLNWNVIVSSPLKRAIQTAEIINESLNLPLIIMEQFIERNYGTVEGLTLEERKSLKSDFHCPKQESREELIQRVLAGMNALHNQYKNQRIIVVAHGGVINSLLSYFSNGEIGSGKTFLTNGGLTYFRFQEGRWVIQQYNQNSHITDIVE